MTAWNSVVLLIAMTLNLLFVATVNADPSPECRNIATLFGQSPESLEVIELAKLRTCVSEQLNRRINTSRLVAPAPPAPAPPMRPGEAP